MAHAHRLLGLAMAAAAFGAVGQARAGSFSYVEIPPGAAGFVFNTGVSGDGKRAVGYTPAGIYYWTPDTGVIYTGGLPPGNGVGGRPRLSEDGTRMCGAYLDVDGKANASLFTFADFTWTLSPNMGANCDITRTSAWEISRDGTVIVGLGYHQTQCNVRPSRWKVGDPATLPLFTWFGWNARINGCNTNGTIMTGWQAQADGRWMACMWKPSGTSWSQVRFLTPAGQLLPGEGQCMSDDGSRVFGSGWFGSKREPFMWTQAGGAVSLGASPLTNYNDGFGIGCTRAGDKVCCFFRPGGTPLAVGEGYMWIEGRGYVPLEQYAAEHGVTIPEGFRLAMPLDMSPDGLAIAGNARSELGGFECTFVLDLHPDQQACPADLDGNRIVNGADLGMLLGNWGGQGVGDLNQDGTVNGADLGALLGAFGTCP